MRTPITERFGIEHPVFAFSVHPPVVAEVSKGGGFGVLGALRFSPEELERELTWLYEHVGGKPYGLNVVMPASYVGAGQTNRDALAEQLREAIPDEHRRFVQEVLERHGVPPLPPGQEPLEGLLGWTDATARPQLEVALSHPIKLLANALGPPPEDVIERAHARGIPVAALVGNPDQARKQVDAGVDILVAQGTEAAGHTGEISTMVLVPDVVDAVHPRPVLAAGGIGTGRQFAAALALGAHGVWTGSIWLAATEADLPQVVLEKLLAAGPRDTVRTRAWTGKPARLLRTAWTDAWDSPESPGTLPMPLQFLATAEAMQRIFLSGNRELAGMPVGQIVGRMNEPRPAAEILRRLVDEADEALAGLGSISLRPAGKAAEER